MTCAGNTQDHRKTRKGTLCTGGVRHSFASRAAERLQVDNGVRVQAVLAAGTVCASAGPGLMHHT